MSSQRAMHYKDWERQLSPTGHYYYYNQSTKVSTYDPPDYPVLTRQVAGHMVTVTQRGELFGGSGWDVPQSHREELLYLLAEARGYKPDPQHRLQNTDLPTKSQKRKRAEKSQVVKTETKRANKQDTNEQTQSAPKIDEFQEPAFQDSEAPPIFQQPQYSDEPGDDPEEFLKFLDAHADPEKSWADQLGDLAVHDEFDLVGAKSRPELFKQWVSKNSCSYMELVKKKWKAGVFYANFKKTYADHPAFNSEYNDKQRETIYRDFTRFSKKSAAERKEIRELYKNDDIRLQVLDMLD